MCAGFVIWLVSCDRLSILRVCLCCSLCLASSIGRLRQSLMYIYIYIYIYIFSFVVCVVCRVKDHPQHSSLLKNTCARQVVSDKWFPPIQTGPTAGAKDRTPEIDTSEIIADFFGGVFVQWTFSGSFLRTPTSQRYFPRGRSQ